MGGTTSPRVLALDLEGTLVADARSALPRPGLAVFLSYCLEAFPRVVLFSYVPRERAIGVLERLRRTGAAPPGAARIEYLDWDFGPYKDLALIPGTRPSEALLVDDQEDFVHPEQLDRWIPVAEYQAPFDACDCELQAVRERLRRRLAGGS